MQEDAERYGGSKALPSWTPAAGDEPAQRLAQRVVDGEAGQRLGVGNFGTAYRGPKLRGFPGGTVVKVGNRADIHGRPWKRKNLRNYLIHEAGVSDELRAAGVNVVPRSVYVEVDNAEYGAGWPVVVREYGDIVEADDASKAEIIALEQALYAVADAGWAVRDVLLVARRPADGSLFVADAGWWWLLDPSKPHDDRAPGVSDLLFRWLSDSGRPGTWGAAVHAGRSAAAWERLLADAAQAVADFGDDADRAGLLSFTSPGRVVKAVDARIRGGFPVPRSVARAAARYRPMIKTKRST
ncbi:MAG: hypothetical protein P1V36_17885 [Planctomycetota bacterium]|nr:hypothetical protein [Planctomycetota bacterium]